MSFLIIHIGAEWIHRTYTLYVKYGVRLQHTVHEFNNPYLEVFCTFAIESQLHDTNALEAINTKAGPPMFHTK